MSEIEVTAADEALALALDHTRPKDFPLVLAKARLATEQASDKLAAEWLHSMSILEDGEALALVCHYRDAILRGEHRRK